jgi:hypothetical protein
MKDDEVPMEYGEVARRLRQVSGLLSTLITYGIDPCVADRERETLYYLAAAHALLEEAAARWEHV